MFKGIKILLILVGILSGCTKLEERIVPLDQHCPGCKSVLEDSLLNVRGIYWARYLPDKAAVRIKYSTQEFDASAFHSFLGRQGFMQFGDTLAKPPLPNCCQNPQP